MDDGFINTTANRSSDTSNDIEENIKPRKYFQLKKKVLPDIRVLSTQRI